MTIDKEFFTKLFEEAAGNPRLRKIRKNYDLRTSEHDGSQRMLNALLPGTEVPIHKHPYSSENIICLCGRMDVILLEEKKERVQLVNAPERGLDAQDVMCRKVFVELKRITLCPTEGYYGCVVPKDTWHTIKVYEQTVIYEAKDGRYAEDGTCFWQAS